MFILEIWFNDSVYFFSENIIMEQLDFLKSLTIQCTKTKADNLHFIRQGTESICLPFMVEYWPHD